MQQRRNKAATWPLIVTPAVIFGVGCFADFALSAVVHGPNAERLLPAIAGLTVGALTVTTFAKRRDAFIAAAAIFSAIAIIAITLALPVAVRASLCVACLATTTAALASYTIVPEQQPAHERADSRTNHREGR